MDQDISYQIPVKSHVFKYLCAHVDVDPFKVSTKNEFSTLLLLCLERKPNTFEKRLNYPERLNIRIPQLHSDSQGSWLSNKKIIMFNEMIERMMKRELYAMLNQGNAGKGDIKRIIFKFRDFYGITDQEMEYQNLRKAYNRERGICK